MIRCEVRRKLRWSKLVQAVALGALTSIVYSGCVGGGASGGGNGISDRDEHGNGPTTATVIIPDGANITGQINFQGDIDFFKFRAIANIGYVLQITGFPPDPDVSLSLDLTGDGIDFLGVQILDTTGATQTGQILNTTGTNGGQPYDVSPAGDEGTLSVVGDSRIVWVSPTTQDYYFVVGHRRQTGIGAYNIRLATSQLMTIFTDEPEFQSGARFVEIFEDSQGEVWDNWIVGGIQAGRWEYIDSLDAILVQIPAAFASRLIFLPDQDEPEPFFMHVHSGFPDIYTPQDSSEQPPAGDNHTFILDEQYDGPSRDGVNGVLRVSEITAELFDGSTARIPVTLEHTSSDGSMLMFHVGDAIVDGASRATGRAFTADAFNAPDFRRLFHGFPWYFDLHPMDYTNPGAAPVAVSLPQGDLYQMFETRMEALPGNVLRDDGTPSTENRGLSPFTIYYEASLKTFQVAMQQYQVFPGGSPGSGDGGPSGFDVGGNNELPPQSFIINPDYAPYVGDRVRVHSGGPGETGPVIINLGTLPPLRLPLFGSAAGDLTAEPGFRNPIRQLTDNEVETLRDAFYEDGFYIEVTDSVTNEPLLRAEGFLEISAFPTLEPCSFPPCSGVAPSAESIKRGTITFASELPEGVSLDLYSNGKLLGVLNQPLAAGAAVECGLGGDGSTLADELYPGTYYWHAHDKNDTKYSGHVTVPSGGCAIVIISVDDLDSDSQ